ncbi:hypothetical protein STL3553_c06620 [Salmonella enterica subsp. enterica serovar Typhimurium str. L-3553]|uniref:Uncharacterized protein n=3 Tax=Salmonella enterica I TaxID=59201 RepID=A0A6C6Z3N8_SALPB|nr:hypothetical protein SPAB_02978 [Salmonella enterica subsp. enterica serovar Paratyphi B str. SPB7]AET54692.1 hypothetical protein SPUL_2381 [Salmonella enterica subsp. enterica serovar Gallinarum/Pullorum str. RKS5078]AGU65191.1 hypothetical protein SPUCDC_2367 [Salmonella enterica subsp. enterica serovar Gallinarum/Pullorum str. CDC1983-67]AIE04524.1 hypothetical protein DC51_0614 [Salmonella enterica subsp. enterica serovar Typhimurium]EDX44485.1 conserved hypothetical protein [Salmonella
MIILLITICICNSVLSRYGTREHNFTTRPMPLTGALAYVAKEKQDIQ